MTNSNSTPNPNDASEEKPTFQFTIGPVQGFVSQARRTRDFWAGSFILSWLSAVAIKSIQAHGGKITFPIPDESYMEWLIGKGKNTPPQQGSIPNRFKALTAKVPQDFQGKKVEEAVRTAWLELANKVWEKDLAHLVTQKTKDIWNRQINNFWEISWVISRKDEANLLDRRKNWRTHVQSKEPGHKCMMMDGWQELSGVIKTNMQEVNNFWATLREANNAGLAEDLRDGERLCAMAFIKRRFARFFNDVKFNLPTTESVESIKIQGWRLPSSVPSVSFLAAAPWLAQAIEHLPVELFENFYQKASDLKGKSHNEISHVDENREGFTLDIKNVKEAVKSRQDENFKKEWISLDGSLYFKTELENVRNFSSYSSAISSRHNLKVKATIDALDKLSHEMASKNLAKSPSPYYAIVLMDGDQLGKHMGDVNKQNTISQALNEFTQKVAIQVHANNGFLIYAGGDDVLALFPMDYAINAAAELQNLYVDTFKKHSATDKKKAVESTLSGAIEFVHIRTPLTQVLRDAHSLLDDVAKDGVGRNALAIRVWKPSGLALEWAIPWEKALDKATNQVLITQLAKSFAQFKSEDNTVDLFNEEKTEFSNKFFFRAKEIIERLGNGLEKEMLEKMLISEWHHSYNNYKVNVDNKAFQLLVEQSWEWYRKAPGADPELNNPPKFNANTALLVRFLAQKGLGRDE